MLFLLKRGLPEKRAWVGSGRPNQSLGFENFHPGEEGQQKKRDNHLVKNIIILCYYTTTFVNLLAAIVVWNQASPEASNRDKYTFRNAF